MRDIRKEYKKPVADVTIFNTEAFMSTMWSGEHATFPTDTSAYDYGEDEEP